VLVEDRAQELRGAGSAVALDLSGEGAGVQSLEDLRLIERALERAAADDRGEIEQGPGDRRTRDPVDLDGVCGQQGRGAVHVDPVVAVTGPAGDRDVDAGAIGAPQLVQRHRGAMREDGAGAAGQHGGEEAALTAQERWRQEGVDAVVHAVQPSDGDTLVDRRRRQSEGAQLGERKHAVLSCRERDQSRLAV